jgi:uncharacterized DUF497 family protein
LLPAPATIEFGAKRQRATSAMVVCRSERGLVAFLVCRRGSVDRGAVPDLVRQLLATDVALDKLGARGISAAEAEQLLHNPHVTVRNPREATARGKRALLIGRTDGGRALTLVIERTVDLTTWLIVTGWRATQAERRMLEG